MCNLSSTVLSQELLKSLESSTDIFLRNLRQCIDLAESSGNTTLAAGDEDTAGDDCFLRLALESLCVIDEFEEVLGRVGDLLGNVDGIAVSADFFVCGKKTPCGLVSG